MIFLDRGEPLTQTWFFQEDGAANDLAGYTVEVKVKNSADEEIYSGTDASSEVTVDTSAGSVQAIFDPSITITWTDSYVEVSCYVSNGNDAAWGKTVSYRVNQP